MNNIKVILIIANKKENRAGELDIMATLGDGTKVNIEMQNEPIGNLGNRSLFYFAKLYLKAVGKNEEFEKMPKTIIIFILKEEQLKEQKIIVQFIHMVFVLIFLMNI